MRCALVVAAAVAAASYAPRSVPCPRVLLRLAAPPFDSPSWMEDRYLALRSRLASYALRRLLVNAAIPGFNPDAFLLKLPPIRIALAVSGGGYRAMLTGSGVLQELDSRTSSSPLAGLLQSLSYITGVSGGAWLVLLMALDNWNPPAGLAKRDLWLLGAKRPDLPPYLLAALLEVPANGSLVTPALLGEIHREVVAKKNAGFKLAFTDYWALVLARLVLPPSARHTCPTMADIAHTPAFVAGHMPFPIVAASGRGPTGAQVPFEFTPFEFGLWDPLVQAFVDVRYLGSTINDGRGVACVDGLALVAFVAATLLLLFNSAVAKVWDALAQAPPAVHQAATAVLAVFGLTEAVPLLPDHAEMPNPFYSTRSHVPGSSYSQLCLLDGGDGGENIALQPLLARGVDVVLAVDASADTDNWPNGTSLRSTAERSSRLAPFSIGTHWHALFPAIPPAAEFQAKGYGSRPVFFGCYLHRFPTAPPASHSGPLPPVVVYLPNHNHVFMSNQSTFRHSYLPQDAAAMVANGRAVASYNHLAVDAEYPRCLVCALMKRQFDRGGLGMAEEPVLVPPHCVRCYARYCHN